MRVGLAGLGRDKHIGDGRMIDEVMTNFRRRRGVAAADARRAHHANAGTGLFLQLFQQRLRTQHGAGERVADANGQRRHIRLAFLHHVEMRIESRGLEHFGKRQLHFVGKCGEMSRRNLAVPVLD